MRRFTLRRCLLTGILLAVLLTTAGLTRAHSHDLHPDLTGLSSYLARVSLWPDQTYTADVEIKDWYNWDIAKIMQGSVDEDTGVILQFRYRDHFYNPHTRQPGNVKPSVTALVAAGKRWTMMEESFAEGYSYRHAEDGGFEVLSINGSLHALGRTLHLLQDMAAPPHVHPPHGHGWWNIWGPGSSVPYYSDFEAKWSPHSSIYEGWTVPEFDGGPLTPNDVITEPFQNSRLDTRAETDLRAKLQAIPASDRATIAGYLESLAWITYYHSSFYGQINKDVEQPVPQTVNGNENILRTLYPDRIAYIPAKITNAWDDGWMIDGVGAYGFRTNMSIRDDWWPCPGSYPEGSTQLKSGGIKGRFYIYHHYYGYNLFYLDAAGTPWQTAPTFFPDGSYNSDQTSLARYYGDVLLPLSVRLGAGLIEKVFPIPSDLQYPEHSYSGQYSVTWDPVAETPAGNPWWYKLERTGDGGLSWETVHEERVTWLSDAPITVYEEQVGPGEYSYRVRAGWFPFNSIYGVTLYGGTCQVTQPVLRVRSSEDGIRAIAGDSGVLIVSDTGHGGRTAYTVSLPYGTVVHLSAPIYSDLSLQKHFKGWTGAVSGEDPAITLVMDGNKSLTAHYAAPSTIALTGTLKVKASESNVQIDSTSGHGGYTNYMLRIPNGSQVHLEAPEYVGSGAARMRFSGWSGSLTSRSRSITLSMIGNMTVTANYAADPQPIRVSLTVRASDQQVLIKSNTGHGGTTNYTVNNLVSGTEVKLEAPQFIGKGADRKSFSQWSGAVNSKDRSISLVLMENATVTAHYSDDPESVLCSLSVQATASGVTISSSTGHGGTTNYILSNLVNGTQVNLQAPQYISKGTDRKSFSHWSGAVNSKVQSIHLTLMADTTITAHYVDDPEFVYRTLTVEANVPNVTVSSTTGHGGTTNYKTSVISGNLVQLAVPQYIYIGKDRYGFSSWSGAVSSNDPSISWLMTANAQVTANYTREPLRITNP